MPSYEPVDSWVVIDRPGEHGQESIAAFTVAELGEMLPPKIKHQGCDWLLMLAAPFNGVWIVYYQVDEGTDKIRDGNKWIMAEKEADAHATMLIYLLENKIISLS
ncbi:MAG TPA: hypothetical protein VK578_10370 [Edaphobacter sp.]|nr:hypothetical protein [Edaphobacter sp.]